MNIDVALTVPILLNGDEVGEFDIMAEVRMTTWGTMATYWEPGDSAEFEVIDATLHGGGSIPPAFKEFVEDYLTTERAYEMILDGVGNPGDYGPDEYERDDYV